ncbi:IS4/IS5 family transposase, partial [Nodosilinea sp. LEGE 07298]
FYVVNELPGTYQGMMIAIPPHLWQGFAGMPVVELADFLQVLAAKVKLKRFLKAPPQKKKKKKKKPSPKYDPKHPHVSTAKLLSGD